MLYSWYSLCHYSIYALEVHAYTISAHGVLNSRKAREYATLTALKPLFEYMIQFKNIRKKQSRFNASPVKKEKFYISFHIHIGCCVCNCLFPVSHS
jgi:hypothetical protein